MNIKWIVLCSALLFSCPLFAREKTDVLVMKNGDRITCEIKALGSDTLYIKVSYILKTLSVDWSEVDHLESSQLFIVKTRDGSVYSGKISTVQGSGERPVALQVIPDSEKKVTLDRSQVIQIDETANQFWQRLNGEIGMGLNYSKGNQSTQYNLNSDVSYPRERWGAAGSFNSTLASSSGASTSTRNEITVDAYHLLRWNNWYYTGLAGFLQSSEQGIQLQTTVGGGVGRFLKNSGRTTVKVIGGLAFDNIRYDEATLPAPTENVTSALIGTNIELFRFDKTTLTTNAYFLPALSDPGRVHLNLNTSYYVKLWGEINWNITFYGNWDNRPPPGFSGSDYGTSSGISWTFGNR